MKKIRKNKKGQGHVEIIFSFIIFLGFLIFLLYFFNPFKAVSGTKNYLDKVERKILENISVEVDVLPLKLNQTINGDCFYIELSSNIGKNVSVFDKNKNKLNASHSDNNIYIERGNSDFYYIYFSDYINENTLRNCNEKAENYTLGLYRSYDAVSSKLLNDFSDYYKNDYSEVRNKIGLPSSINFAVTFYNSSNDQILKIGEVPKKTTIYSRTVLINIIYEDGNFEYGLMNIRVW